MKRNEITAIKIFLRILQKTATGKKKKKKKKEKKKKKKREREEGRKGGKRKMKRRTRRKTLQGLGDKPCSEKRPR